MKAAVVILLCVFCSIECRKVVQVSKHANLDFINNESGGQGYQPRPATPVQPSNPPKSPTQPEAPKTPTAAPVKPIVTPQPVVTPTPAAVVPVTTAPSKPVQPQQPRPNQGIPTQMDLKPVQPGRSVGGSVTTPGPGSVQQLVTYYNSQGKASNIRPYSYSDAVKKGK